MKMLLKLVRIILTLIAGGFLGASIWLLLFEKEYPITFETVIFLITFMPVNNTLGILVCWEFYSKVESFLIVCGIMGSIITILAYLKSNKILWLFVLAVSSVLWSIKSVFSFYALMSV